MKIKEIICEELTWNSNPADELETDEYLGFDNLDKDGNVDVPPEMELSSNADAKMIRAVKRVCDEYKGQGHAQVEILPFLSKVMEIAKKPVNLADLIAINKKSGTIRSMIDSIDDKKIKFKNMSVKNEDPKKKKEAKNATVSAMASRRAGRD